MMAAGAGDEPRRVVAHYSSDHQILLVGDGDFSFSLSLAYSFGSAFNIVATSLDTFEELVEKYKRAGSNIQVLRMLGAQVFHGVDATKMKLLPDLRMRKFDRIIFNFPHAGFHGKEVDPQLIKAHSKLVQGFFKNASAMLRPDGEVHVNHKTSKPYCDWNIKGLAYGNCLFLLDEVRFRIQDYPWYNNKRGDGKRADDAFHLGECSTFKFTLHPHIQRERIVGIHHNSLPSHQHYEVDLIKWQYDHQPTSVPVMSNNVGGYNGGAFDHRLPANNVPLIAPDRIVPESPPSWSYFGRSTTGGGTLLDVDDHQRFSEQHHQRRQESLWRMRVRLYGQYPEVA